MQKEHGEPLMPSTEIIMRTQSGIMYQQDVFECIMQEIRALYDRVEIDTPVIITTSSDTFEGIAASHGFHVGPQSEKYEKVITLLD